jgi:hypothetical protein
MQDIFFLNKFRIDIPVVLYMISVLLVNIFIWVFSSMIKCFLKKKKRKQIKQKGDIRRIRL